MTPSQTDLRHATGYFYGGKPGLPIGSYILPAAEMGSTRANLIEYLEERDASDRYEPSAFCYLTTDLDWATVFASYHLSRRGCVYRVEPVGEVMEDVDGVSVGEPWFKCERAKIVGVVKVPFTKMHKLRQRHASGQSLGTGCFADYLFLETA